MLFVHCFVRTSGNRNKQTNLRFVQDHVLLLMDVLYEKLGIFKNQYWMGGCLAWLLLPGCLCDC